MAYDSENGKKISAYPEVPVLKDTFPGKIKFDSYLLGYSHAYFGINTYMKNYQFPIATLRTDFARYVGIEGNHAKYRNMIHFWYGYWNHTRKSRSYVYEWKEEDRPNPDYNPEKFNLDGEHDQSLFVLKTAPFPMEEENHPESSLYHEGVDPHIETTKIVDKKYIDDRMNGFRVVDVVDTTNIPLRPYSCYYFIRNVNQDKGTAIKTINFVNPALNGYRNDLYDITTVLRHNRVQFYIILEDHIDYHRLDTKNNVISWEINGVNKSDTIFGSDFSEHSLFARTGSYDGKYIIECEAWIENNDLRIILKNNGNTRDSDITDTDYSKKIIFLDMDGNQETQEIPLIAYINDTFDFSFLTKISTTPNNNVITFNLTDMAGNYIFANEREYSWEFFIETLDENADNSILWDENIMWAMSDYYNQPPKLKSNRLYCFEFTKLLNGMFIGRIKYFVSLLSLVKKNS